MQKKIKQDPELPQGFSVTFRKRFWDKVNKSGPIPSHKPELGSCWQWTAACGYAGYGTINKGGIGAKLIISSRASWIIHNGDPGEFCVLHKCDNPKCVNPEHLWLGTMKQNTQDMLSKKRHMHGMYCGEANACAKLKLSDVELIRLERKNGIPVRKIAEKHSISRDTVYKILNGKLWAHGNLALASKPTFTN